MNLAKGSRIAARLLIALAITIGASQTSALDIEAVAAHDGRTRLLEGNRVELLDDGAEAFERRLELVKSAQHHLLISTFIWRTDAYGLRMIDAIAERIQEVESDGGHLEVLVILDDSTPHASNDFWSSVRKRLRKTGAQVRYFNPPRWGIVPFYAARLHDKILIADGRTTVFGGRNLSDHYFVIRGHSVWYDADVFVEGPAVEDLQMHWLKTWALLGRLKRVDRFLSPPDQIIAGIRQFWRTGYFPNGDSPLEPYANREWFPKLQPAGNVQAGILYDNPLVWDVAPTHDVVKALVDGAKNRIDIVTPFPNMPATLIDALSQAVRRGVEVRLVTNSEERALRTGAFWRTLLPSILELSEAGVQVWGWTGANGTPEPEAIEACDPKHEPYSNLHAKMLQVDGRFAIVTASNFNVRSTWYNTEAGILAVDPALASEIESRVDLLIGAEPFTMHCADGSELGLPHPAEFVGEQERKAMQQELDAFTGSVESYGPVY